MIRSLLSILAHLSAIWCFLVMTGFSAKMIWLAMTVGWGLF